MVMHLFRRCGAFFLFSVIIPGYSGQYCHGQSFSEDDLIISEEPVIRTAVQGTFADNAAGPVTVIFTSSGSNDKEIIWGIDNWQKINYQCDFTFTLTVEKAGAYYDMDLYNIIHLEGTIRFWGTAEDRYLLSSEYYNFDYNREITYEGLNGVLEYARDQQEVTYIGFSIDNQQLGPYYIGYYGFAEPHSTHVYTRLPEMWYFEEYFEDRFEICEEAFGADFRYNPLKLNRIKNINHDHTAFHSDQKCWVITQPGGYIEVVFDLDQVPSVCELVLQHLSSASGACPNGGYSPVEIQVNDANSIEHSYDPASHNCNTHAFVLDRWDIKSKLKLGENKIRITAKNLCTLYWLRHLHIQADGLDCAQVAFDSPQEEIIRIDLQKSKNHKFHITDSFKTDSWDHPRLIVRRGYYVTVELHVQAAAAVPKEQISFMAFLKSGGQEESFEISYDPVYESDEWAVYAVEEPQVVGDTWIYKMLIHPPVDAPVGEYEFQTFLTPTPDLCQNEGRVFPEPVVILFNPWEPEDTTFCPLLEWIPDYTKLKEYILNETGILWQRRGFGEKLNIRWNFGQFDEVSLDATLEMLKEIPVEECGNPAKVSRHYTHLINENVLLGNWLSNYEEVVNDLIQKENWASPVNWTEPTEWKGSAPIFDEFLSENRPVLFGQCWVFGGLLTSLLRTSGIPARPITNYDSFHDKQEVRPFNRFQETYYTDQAGYDLLRSMNKHKKLIENGGRYFDKGASETLWGYHVWVEAWMARPNRSDQTGQTYRWQAVDATPQEKSDGLYQMGPAPVAAVKDPEIVWNSPDEGGPYDLRFVFNEVNDYSQKLTYLYRVEQDGTKIVDKILGQATPLVVGTDIRTKQIGNTEDYIDLKPSYKETASSPAPLFASAQMSEDVEITFDADPNTIVGQDMTWSLTLTNQAAESRHCSVAMSCFSLNYRGDILDRVAGTEADLTLGSGQQETIELMIPEPNYIHWISDAGRFEVYADVNVIETDQLYLNSLEKYLIGEPLTAQLDETMLYPQDSSVCQVNWQNPFSNTTLHNIKLIYSVGDSLQIEGGKELTVFMGDLLPGELLADSRVIEGLLPGLDAVEVRLETDELPPLLEAAFIVVDLHPGDFGGDNRVDMEDFEFLSDYWQVYEPSIDVSPLGVIGLEELSILADYWLMIY